MAKSTTQKTKKEEPVRDAFRYEEADVVITRQGEREVLQIDGQIFEFYHTERGYRLKADVFRKPHKTLREAAEAYLRERAAR